MKECEHFEERREVEEVTNSAFAPTECYSSRFLLAQDQVSVMPAFCAPPFSSFHGTSVRPSVARRACARQSRRPPTVSAVAPMEDRRAAEIERLARQLAQLKAQKAAIEAQGKAASVPKEPAPWPAEAPRPSAHAEASAPSSSKAAGPVLERLGKHGEKSHFCGMSTLDGQEYAPRIVPVLGKIPGLSPSSFEDVPILESGKRKMGSVSWSYVPTGYPGELVAIDCPTSELGKTKKLVAARVDVSHVAPHFDPGVIGDGLALIECSLKAKEFDNLKFYAWGINGEVHIGWMPTCPLPEEASCLGRVLCIFIEENPNRVKAKSCWKEEDEVW